MEGFNHGHEFGGERILRRINPSPPIIFVTSVIYNL